MTKLRTSSSKKKISGIVKLKIVLEKLYKISLLMSRPLKSSSYCDDDFEEVSESRSYVPEDVKEGHFAVIAVDGEVQPKRFVIPLSYLSHPRFLELLEQAAEEYGFDHIHEGALTIPCRPIELERLLAADDHEYQRWQQEGDSTTTTTGSTLGVNWRSCDQTMVPIY
ncbi:hypothetical protein Ddye_025192 [Dipteronia dyeriana]|uniref:Small auxin up regulated protein n=1 Tax=Dipteronia dyeriana TaxID=168575 RepID=A0AAD9TXA1_9ROSI|nr:hypothetical protein Ddye_025192 [Dipteronia dyeriana]